MQENVISRLILALQIELTYLLYNILKKVSGGQNGKDIYRDGYYNPDSEDRNTAEVIIAKHRAGSTGMFKLGWQGQYTKFTNIDYRTREAQ